MPFNFEKINPYVERFWVYVMTENPFVPLGQWTLTVNYWADEDFQLELRNGNAERILSYTYTHGTTHADSRISMRKHTIYSYKEKEEIIMLEPIKV